MEIKKVLIVYKRSSYETHVMTRPDPVYVRLLRHGSVATRYAKKVHREHARSFESIQKDLKDLGIRFDVRLRYHLEKIPRYDLILTFGGDGTFLQTSHYIERGLLMGINSAPFESVGFFCRTNRRNFRKKMLALLAGRQRFKKLHRLKLEFSDGRRSPYVLNEILFTNRNPAGTTRYLLRVGGREEEQKSSGIWVAPAPGSTAAIGSAGGRRLPIDSDRFQYVIREPYQPPDGRYRHVAGTLTRKGKIRILSMMDEARVFVDGPHIIYPIPRGQVVTLSLSKRPLYVVW